MRSGECDSYSVGSVGRCEPFRVLLSPHTGRSETPLAPRHAPRSSCRNLSLEAAHCIPHAFCRTDRFSAKTKNMYCSWLQKSKHGKISFLRIGFWNGMRRFDQLRILITHWHWWPATWPRYLLFDVNVLVDFASVQQPTTNARSKGAFRFNLRSKLT